MQSFKDRKKLETLHQTELNRFIETHPESDARHRQAKSSMLGGVPMIWMSKWPGPFPIYVESAKGSHFTDIDGHEYVDFCLGDTGAMSGHAPDPTVRAVQAQIAKGSTYMLPTTDSITAAELLQQRFGLPTWQFTLSATDANRHLIRYARHVSKRPKIAIHDYCYHGSVDETFAVLDEHGNTVARKDNIGKPVNLDHTTVVVPFNDLMAAELAFSGGEVAAMLIEPAMTNIGIVLPEPGYLMGLRDLCDKYQVLLIIDETHTLSAGIGGMTRTHNLRPDAVVLGKTIGGGVPVGAFGLSEKFADQITNSTNLESIDVGGVGGTLAGNALSMAAVVATLSEVLTEKAFLEMERLATIWVQNVQGVIESGNLPWQVSQIGCRGEYSFRAEAPRNGQEANAAEDFELQQYLQLHAMNRGVLMTPFHNMALMSPKTTDADLESHLAHFKEATESLLS